MGTVKNVFRVGLFAWALAGLGVFGPGLQQGATHGASTAIMGAIGAGVWVVRAAFGWG